jgi:Tfp pilus assembly protein PilF
VHFQRGEFKRALEILGPLIDRKSAILSATAFLAAAESARIEGKISQAINILEIACARYPDRLSILNNLAYYLAQDTNTVDRAMQLLPRLLEMGKNRFEVLDTAAVICLRAGKLDSAESYAEKALEQLDEKHYSALETRLNAAEIKFRRGVKAEARKIIETIIQNTDAPEIVKQRAIRLLTEIKDSERK